MTDERSVLQRHMIVLGGSLHHPGGLEAFCARAVDAIALHGHGWAAQWWPNNTAYLTFRRLVPAISAWRRLAHAGQAEADIIWLQWSTLADLLFLWRAKARGFQVMVTPHLGANSRLQRSPVLRRLCTCLLARADRIALLFDGQDREIALPDRVPRTSILTFLPHPDLVASHGAIRPAPSGRCLRLIHAGRLSVGKGSFRMVALCAALRRRGIAFEARIVGRADPAVMAALARAIADAGVADVLTLDDWMDGPALRAALGGADVLVHLSELDSFPLIVLEALAAATAPIVADMVGARTIVTRYGGFVSDGRDVDGPADWLAAQDPVALRAGAALAAVRVRQDHAWPACVDRLTGIADLTLATGGACRA